MTKTDKILDLIDRGIGTSSKMLEHMTTTTQGAISGMLHQHKQRGNITASRTWPRVYKLTELGKAKLDLARKQEKQNGSLAKFHNDVNADSLDSNGAEYQQITLDGVI